MSPGTLLAVVGALGGLPPLPRPRVRTPRPDLGERALAEAKRARRAALRCERIERAAIRTADGTVYSVRRPLRHHHVIHVMGRARWLEHEATLEQGFVTDRGRFVGREEALAIATAAGQIQSRCGGDDIRLYSENLW